MEYALLVWCQYLADGTDAKTILTIEESGEQTNPASSIINAAAVATETERVPSSSAIPKDEEDWKMGNLVEVGAERRVGVKRRLCNLQEPCRVKKWKVPESEVEAVDPAVLFADDAVVAMPGAVGVTDLHIDELSGQSAGTRDKIILLTPKVYVLKEVRDKARLEHRKLSMKSPTEVNLSEERNGAECDAALFRYHEVLRSIRGIVKAADERAAVHADKLTSLQLFFKEGRKVKAVSSLAGPTQEELCVAELESALAAKE